MVSIRTLRASLGYLLPKSTQFLHNSAPIQPRDTNYSLPVKATVHAALCQTPADPTVKATSPCLSHKLGSKASCHPMIGSSWLWGLPLPFAVKSSCGGKLQNKSHQQHWPPSIATITSSCPAMEPFLGPWPHPKNDKIPSLLETGPGHKAATVSSPIHHSQALTCSGTPAPLRLTPQGKGDNKGHKVTAQSAVQVSHVQDWASVHQCIKTAAGSHLLTSL